MLVLVPDVLDALVRTILSQNTTSKNSTTARQNIEEHYGKGPNYEAVRLGSQEELKEAIQSGGLANVKARVIKKILDQVYEKEGKLSLDRLHTVGDEDALRELVSFDGVGPKTVRRSPDVSIWAHPCLRHLVSCSSVWAESLSQSIVSSNSIPLLQLTFPQHMSSASLKRSIGFRSKLPARLLSSI